MKNHLYYLLPLLGGIAISSTATAQENPIAAVTELQVGWDHVQYQISGKDAQAKAFQELEVKADAAVKNYPQSAEAKIWDGIIYSSDAGAAGGVSALSKVEKAKALFEGALAINERAMNGGAHTSLGSLYYKVPGWPLGFGDDEKAKQQLETALAISPNDIDANYFYGDFLVDQKQFGKAIPVLEKAMQAPRRPGREIADDGRRKEIQADIDSAKSGQ